MSSKCVTIPVWRVLFVLIGLAGCAVFPVAREELRRSCSGQPGAVQAGLALLLRPL